MSLGLVVGASDGLLVVADGRNSRRDLTGKLRPCSDDVAKIALADQVPVAVVATGKSHLRTPSGSCLVASLIQRHLESVAREIRHAANPVLTVARTVGSFLEEALAKDRLLRLSAGAEDVDEIGLSDLERGQFFEVLVAGLQPAGGAMTLRLTVDHQGQELAPEHGFGVRPLATVPHRPTSYLDSNEFAGMPSDLVEEFFDPKATAPRPVADHPNDGFGGPEVKFVLTALPLIDLSLALQEALGILVERHRTSFDAYGVGGTWTFVGLGRGREPDVKRLKLGPMMTAERETPVQGGCRRSHAEAGSGHAGREGDIH